MIFLCFSSKDRYSIVESVMYHLKNYGLSVWYDYHKLILGDDRDYRNLVEGIEQNNHAIIIVTSNIVDCVCANDEIAVIHKQYTLGKIHVFPIFYKISALELPSEYQWLCRFIYNEIDDTTGTLLTCNQIILKYIIDKNRIYDIKELIDYEKLSFQDNFIIEMLSTYFEIDSDNLNAKVLTLFSVFKYLICKYESYQYPNYCMKTFKRLYDLTRLKLQINWKELSILENSLLLMLNIVNQYYKECR